MCQALFLALRACHVGPAAPSAALLIHSTVVRFWSGPAAYPQAISHSRKVVSQPPSPKPPFTD
ncbi:rCG29822 [Rattus norvegicus]|uniref:RCG29822 n=1 Tax=Rattus norvegicus TaxID=10116 RepID=A6IL98_RAT|nr:rCG29822 [Rattus norvegicus]